jgi:DNA-binding SARP family transcriptional activator
VTRPGLADSLDGITMPPRRWRYVSATLPDQSPLRTHVRLCGRLSIEIDGREVVGRMRGRQVPLLAVYLLLHRARAIARDELELALWPDSAPRSQDAALRTLLSRLRSALGADAVSGRDGILLRLPEPVWIDLEAAGAHVVAARSALGLDDPRAAVTAAQTAQDIAARGLLPGAQAVWLEGPRRELADLQVQALELIGQAGLRLGAGELSTVQRAGRTLVELEPYRESGYVLLMRVLAAQGNLAEGLWVYDQLRSLLRDELGVAPSAEAIAVHEGLLGVGAPGDHTEGEPAGEPIELPAAMRMAAAAPLVGREAELSAMRAWWRAGTERIFMLDGEPGTGKSRLLAALAGDAHGAGAVVLAGHAHEEMLAPYESFLQAIGQYVDGAPLGQLRAVVHRSGTAAAEVARLVPERLMIQRRTATASLRRSPRCSASLPSSHGCCSCSTICNGPDARRCCCCATWRARREPHGSGSSSPIGRGSRRHRISVRRCRRCAVTGSCAGCRSTVWRPTAPPPWYEPGWGGRPRPRCRRRCMT